MNENALRLQDHALYKRIQTYIHRQFYLSELINYFRHIFRFNHLADAFVQSDVQGRGI